MTRDDVARGYNLDEHGCVRNPGKFEGEHWSTVAAYDIVMEGGGSETLYWDESRATDVIILDDELRHLWEIEPDQHAFLLDTTGQGFVFGTTVTCAKYDELIAEYELINDTSTKAPSVFSGTAGALFDPSMPARMRYETTD